MKNSLLIPILATGAICLASPGFSATETSNLSVVAVVADTCTVVAGTALAWVSFESGGVVDQSTPGVITVVCSSIKTGITVDLGGGGNSSGTQRRMVDGTAFLPYNVHKDSGHTNAVAIDGEIFSGNTAAAVPIVIEVFGQIPAGDYSAGTYSDTVTVTLTYP